MLDQKNIGLICRVCLDQEKKMVSIFEKYDDGVTSIDKILNECIDCKFKQLEGLPQQICIDCKELALNAFKFKRKCEEACMQLMEKLNLHLENFQKNVETQTENTSMHLCGNCDEKYFSLNDLKIHQLEVHKAEAMKCNFCKKSFSCVEILQSHLTAFHSEAEFQSSSQCFICNEEFACPKILSQHLTSTHTITKNLDEKSCKQQLIRQTDVLSSLPDIEEVDLKIFSESNLIPDNSNEKDEDLLVYIKQLDDRTDDEDNKPLSVLQQTKSKNDIGAAVKFGHEFKADQLTTLKYSEAIVSDEAVTSEQDKNIVQAKVPRKNKSKLEAKTKHEEKAHKCDICEKMFKTATYLQRHVILHAKKRFNCRECSESFITKAELHDHIKSEGHDKRLLCPVCGLRSRTSNILMVHLRRHKGEKPFKCKFCSKGFPRSDDLKLHEKYHTGEKSHFCGTCGKGFQRKYNLKIHLRVHTGEKPHKCPHCPQAFAQGNDLKAHIRRHTGERFRCGLCDAAFLQGYQLRQHKLTEHGIQDEPPTQRVAKFTSIEAQKQQILQNMTKDSS